MRLIGAVMKDYRPEVDDTPTIRRPPIKPDEAHPPSAEAKEAALRQRERDVLPANCEYP